MHPRTPPREPFPCIDAIVTDVDETLTFLDDEFLTQLSWLTDRGFPREEGDTFLSNTATFASGRRATNFKTAAIRRLQEQGWNFAWAYGNAMPDIAAFRNVGIPDDHIFGVGRLSETLGVVPIADEAAYTDHLVHLEEVARNCP